MLHRLCWIVYSKKIQKFSKCHKKILHVLRFWTVSLWNFEIVFVSIIQIHDSNFINQRKILVGMLYFGVFDKFFHLCHRKESSPLYWVHQSHVNLRKKKLEKLFFLIPIKKSDFYSETRNSNFEIFQTELKSAPD